MPTSNLPRIAALGYYGFGNLGDEAVLAGIRSALLHELGSHELAVLSANPAETLRLHPGVSTVDRWNWRGMARALRGTDLFILGGGSLLQDATSVQSVVWYTLMALLARRCCRRVVWWGQGIGPLRSPIARRLVALIANQADALTVRDEDSAALLKAIGARGSIHQVADPAFSLQPLALPQASNAQTSREKCSVVVALRSWKEDELGAALKAGSLSALISEGRVHESSGAVCGFPMHLPDDADYMRSLNDENLLVRDWHDEKWNPELALGFVQNSELVVAMRLHALIFAARCAVPFVAISYDPKVDALAAAAGQRDALVPVAGITAAGLRDVIERVRDSSELRRSQLNDFAVLQRDRARLPARISRDLL